MAPPRKYHSEEERRLARNAASKRWADANRRKASRPLMDFLIILEGENA
jgi:hypothetical protein